MKYKINRDWEFMLSGGDAASWRKLDLPHDWAVEGDFSPENYIPAVREESHLEYRHDSFLPRGKGTYRKKLTIPQKYSGQRVLLEFDGVFGESRIRVDGDSAGENFSGYTGAVYDITALCAGKNAVDVEVDVDAERMQGWWYEGAGIYRHVWLHILPGCAFDPWGIAVTSPQVAAESATVEVVAEAVNIHPGAVSKVLIAKIYSPKGDLLAEKSFARKFISGKNLENFSFQIADPDLWDVDNPVLYTLQLTLDGEDGIDRAEVKFGIRTFEFTPDRGFFLNGRHLQLRGGNLHHDFGGLGTALPDRAHEKNVEVLKEMGANVIRSAHNPSAPALLDACDRLGMLFWAETRNLHWDKGAEKDLISLIRRDRNHPSLILWSLANTGGAMDGRRYLTDDLQKLHDLAKKLDPSRPTVAALEGNADANANGFALVTDVVGYNGGGMGICDRDHRLYPDRCMVVSEYSSGRGARGIYCVPDDPESETETLGDGRVMRRNGSYATEFDLIKSHISEWEYVALRPYLAGGLMWSAIEYRGETCGYPVVTSQFGVLDICRFPKDIYYYYRKLWSKEPVLHCFPPWHHPGREGKMTEIFCFSNCDVVELFFDGKKIPGIPEYLQPGSTFPYLNWTLPYKSGTVTAVGKINGVEVCRQYLTSPGAVAGLKLTADREKLSADGEDLAFIRVDVVDKDGNFVPDAAENISVTVSGCGVLAGIASGDPVSHEKESALSVRTFNGSALVIVRTTQETGWIDVQISGENLAPGIVRLAAG